MNRSLMEWEDYLAAQKFLERKSLGLMKHERKGIAKTGFPPQNYLIYPIKGRIFYTASSNVFKHILHVGVLLEAITKTPQLFGTGNALDVIEAIRLVEPSFPTTERHAEFLQNEQFCYVMENKGGAIDDKILRIDLFRVIKKDSSGNPEFIGGILHAFKHFSFHGTNLSTGTDINDIGGPHKIIEMAIKAFFISEHIEEEENGFVSRIELNDNYWLRFSFYYEKVNGVYFINTIYKEAKPKPKQERGSEHVPSEE